jgi:acylphosphatase
MSIKRVHLQISGRVQGVFYRGWTADQAHKRDLSGWVRNRFDGSVEAVFEGPGEVVDEMVKLCHDGPSHAQVDSILDDYSEPVEGLLEFKVRNSV